MRRFFAYMLAPFTRLYRFIREIRYLASILEAHSIARRMFVTNAFDSLLSTLGIVLGLYVARIDNPLSYVSAVAGGVGLMGVFSGFIATYLSERSERLRELHETERVMLHDLRGSIYWRAAHLVPLYVALWSATGAILLPMLSITPLVLELIAGARINEVGVYASVSIILIEMFLLGFYLGRISGENPLLSGARFLVIGLAATGVMLLLRIVSG